MNLLVADSFTESLRKLTGDEQKAAKITATDLLLNPAQPGLQFHKLDKPRDKNFWSIRVSSDLRLIVHRSESSLLLCYVAHHDDAYKWAERRKIETHPKTGAAQIVEIRELTREVVVPKYVERQSPRRGPFADTPESELLAYGVPPDWLDTVRAASTDDAILEVAGHLPAEAAEALVNIASGLPATRSVVQSPAEPFVHPDALRRFRTIHNQDELHQALDYPWDKWLIFLHPSQREIVERGFNGPARVAGSAGTGKTIVALHRAVHLARTNPSARVLLTTLSETLANSLRQKLRLLLAPEPRLGEQIEVEALDQVGLRLYKSIFGPPRFADPATIRKLLAETESKFSPRFLLAEWEQVVDAWQLRTWEAYRDVNRLGRRTRLPEAARQSLWKVFDHVLHRLDESETVTLNQVFTRLAEHFTSGNAPPYDYAVVDEAQDISVAQLKFLASLLGSLDSPRAVRPFAAANESQTPSDQRERPNKKWLATGGQRPDALFFAGDLGQRIFQQPFSWKSLGVDIRGRSSTLRVNYRTSQEIRRMADRLLGPEVSDVDGNTDRRAAISVVQIGLDPEVAILGSEAKETDHVARWLGALATAGAKLEQIALFVRSKAELPRAEAAAQAAGLPYRILDAHVAAAPGKISLGTMHLAKGLEFRFVAVIACDDKVIPNQERIAAIGDPADLEEVYNTERQLLYVACTRARDDLLITGTYPASEFLEDLKCGTVP